MGDKTQCCTSKLISDSHLTALGSSLDELQPGARTRLLGRSLRDRVFISFAQERFHDFEFFHTTKLGDMCHLSPI